MIPTNITRQRPHEQYAHIRGGFAGTIRLRLKATGLGSTAAGAPPASEVCTFLGHIFGTTAVASSTGTTATGGTATVPTLTAASGFAAGSMCRIGSLGDARGNGQFVALSAHGSNNLTLLTGIDAAPNSGDVVYAPRMIYPYEETHASFSVPTTFRFRALTANQRYWLRGCYPTSVTLSQTSPGESPEWEIEMAVSQFETNSATFPNTDSINTYAGFICAGGSMFRANVGTATRTTRAVRQCTITWAFRNVSLPGINGNFSHQVTTGAVRAPMDCTIEFLEDAQDAGTHTAQSDWDSEEAAYTKKHLLYTLSSRDGASMGLYFPNCIIVGDRPTQEVFNGVNAMRWRYMATTGATTTTDLTSSAFRIALA